MRNHRYTAYQELWLKEHIKDFCFYRDLQKAYNVTFDTDVTARALQHKCLALGLKMPHPSETYRGKHNGKFIPRGSETIRKTGGTGRLMWFVKVDDKLCAGNDSSEAIRNNWKPKHKIIWEQAHGKIAKGHKVIFLNNDSLDCRLENLCLVSDAAHLQMIKNNWYSEFPDLTLAAIKLCELQRSIKDESDD